jgi:hypothetical protein
MIRTKVPAPANLGAGRQGQVSRKSDAGTRRDSATTAIEPGPSICSFAIDPNGCKELAICRVNHHKLRHFFATA